MAMVTAPDLMVKPKYFWEDFKKCVLVTKYYGRMCVRH